jgi:hypothetical protein
MNLFLEIAHDFAKANRSSNFLIPPLPTAKSVHPPHWCLWHRHQQIAGKRQGLVAVVTGQQSFRIPASRNNARAQSRLRLLWALSADSRIFLKLFLEKSGSEALATRISMVEVTMKPELRSLP